VSFCVFVGVCAVLGVGWLGGGGAHVFACVFVDERVCLYIVARRREQAAA